MPEPVLLVVSLVWRRQRWRAEVTDPASPVAGMSVSAWTRRTARRRIALAAAHELGFCSGLPSAVEVIEWRAVIFSLTRR